MLVIRCLFGIIILGGIAGAVTDARGDCIHEILVGDKIFSRHVEQILQNHTEMESTNIDDDGEFMN